MKMRIIIALAASGLISSVKAEDQANPPVMWKAAFQNRGQLIWDKLRKDDGNVTASEVIEWMYKNHLSHHDGDSQLDAAFCLIQLPDDPSKHLRKMMVEEEPERRAYAVYIAGILGDFRFSKDIERLTGDDAKLGQFDGDWFWDTVGDAAKEAARSLAKGGVAASMKADGAIVAAWHTTKKQNKSEMATPRKLSD